MRPLVDCGRWLGFLDFLLEIKLEEYKKYVIINDNKIRIIDVKFKVSQLSQKNKYFTNYNSGPWGPNEFKFTDSFVTDISVNF